MTPIELLKASRELITPPEKWNQGEQIRHHYKSDSGVMITSHCAYGALLHSKKDEDQHVKHSAVLACVDMLNAAIPPDSELKNLRVLGWCNAPTSRVCAYNNQTPHDGVLAWFDRAIERAESC